MPKHKRKSKQDRESESFEEVANLHPSTDVVIDPDATSDQTELAVSNIPESLAAIRAEALQTDAGFRNERLEIQAETARTIADLEAWRDEIDRTIAFLKARR
jgi:hypothetical protein